MSDSPARGQNVRKALSFQRLRERVEHRVESVTHAAFAGTRGSSKSRGASPTAGRRLVRVLSAPRRRARNARAEGRKAAVEADERIGRAADEAERTRWEQALREEEDRQVALALEASAGEASLAQVSSSQWPQPHTASHAPFDVPPPYHAPFYVPAEQQHAPKHMSTAMPPAPMQVTIQVAVPSEVQLPRHLANSNAVDTWSGTTPGAVVAEMAAGPATITTQVPAGQNAGASSLYTPTTSAPGMRVRVNEVQLTAVGSELLNGHGAVILVINIPGQPVTPEPLPAVLVTPNTRVASINHTQLEQAAMPPMNLRWLLALEAPDETECDIRFGLYNLDAPYPRGKMREEIGVASVSLKTLLATGHDRPLSPADIINPVHGKIGTLGTAVTALNALRCIQRAGPSMVKTLVQRGNERLGMGVYESSPDKNVFVVEVAQAVFVRHVHVRYEHGHVLRTRPLPLSEPGACYLASQRW